MESSAFSAAAMVEKFIAAAVLLQTAELLAVRASASDHGVWSWQVLKDEFEVFPGWFRRVLALTLPQPNFARLLGARLVCAVLLLFTSNALLVFVLFASTILVCLRWRGVFNGGSDYMTLVVLSALLVARLFPLNRAVAAGCLWYIAIQVVSSYFIAGLVKVRRQNWRSGRALAGFLQSALYPLPGPLNLLVQSRSASAAASWGIIAFELSFPLALINAQICAVFVGLALLFHLLNSYVFGLNRFLFAWAAGYPALMYCSNFSGF